MRELPRVTLIAAGFILPAIITACKARVPSSGLESSGTNASSRPMPSNLVFQESILAPLEDNSKEAPSERDARTSLRNAGVTLDPAGARISSKVLLTGERVFFLKEDQQSTPIASVSQGIVYQWSQVTNASRRASNIQYSLTNIFVKHVMNQEPSIGTDPNYLLYMIDQEPIVIALTDHLMMNDHFEFRYGNTFYSETKNRLFEFAPIDASTWRVTGHLDNGHICSGSVLWHNPSEPDTFYSATKQYGSTLVSKWTRSAGLLHFKESVQKPSQFQSKISAAQSCPGRDEVSIAKALAKESYFVSSNVATNVTNATPIEKLKRFPAGTRVIIDGTIYATLFATSKEDFLFTGDTMVAVQNPEVYVTNVSKTVPTDNGQVMGRVYKWYDGKLSEIGTTDSYLVALADQVHKLSVDRIKATNAGIKESDSARWQLALAEQKAATVDTPGKLAVAFVTFAICDALFNAMEEPGKQVAGMVVRTGLKAEKNILQSVAKIDLFGPATGSTRLAAALFLTGLQGITLTSMVDDLQTYLSASTTPQQKLAQSLGSTPSLGLRGFFPNHDSNYLPSKTAGLTMRWGAVSAEQKAAYSQNDNLNKLAQINPKTATKMSSVYTAVFNMTNDTLKMAGPVGILISDIISNQATPSRIVGGTFEIMITFLVLDPRVRPFAGVLGKQLNAMLQLTEAKVRTTSAGEKLDDAMAMIQLQRAARDALLWLANQAPHQLSKLNPVEQAYVVATISDPYLMLRANFTPERI